MISVTVVSSVSSQGWVQRGSVQAIDGRNDQMLWFSVKTSSDTTWFYEKHLSERDFVTLGRHWNPFSARDPPRTQLGNTQHSLKHYDRLGRGKGKPLLQ